MIVDKEDQPVDVVIDVDDEEVPKPNEFEDDDDDDNDFLNETPDADELINTNVKVSRNEDDTAANNDKLISEQNEKLMFEKLGIILNYKVCKMLHILGFVYFTVYLKLLQY